MSVNKNVTRPLGGTRAAGEPSTAMTSTFDMIPIERRNLNLNCQLFNTLDAFGIGSEPVLVAWDAILNGKERTGVVVSPVRGENGGVVASDAMGSDAPAMAKGMSLRHR